MTKSLRLLTALLVSSLAVSAPRMIAQTTDDAADSATPAAPVKLTKDQIENINGKKNIFPAPQKTKPFRLAIYKGKGSGDGGGENVKARAMQVPGATVTFLSGEQIASGELTNDKFDAVAFTGGSGSGQSAGIGKEGLVTVRKFVENGGGYLGICAGSYLAADYSWGLKIVNAKTVSPKWKRGQAYLDLEVDSKDGYPITGEVKGIFKCRYANGPILTPSTIEGLPPYKVAAYFRTETALNGAPAGVQVGAPAALYSTFGKGRIFLLSPHPENTPGLENFVPRALLWITANTPVATSVAAK